MRKAVVKGRTHVAHLLPPTYQQPNTHLPECKEYLSIDDEDNGRRNPEDEEHTKSRPTIGVIGILSNSL